MCQTKRWWCFVVCVAPLLAGGTPTLHAEESARGKELRQLLNKPVTFEGIEDPKETLNDALDLLAKAYNLSFDINEHAFTDDDIKEVHKFEIATPVPVPPMKTNVRSVLMKILRRVSPSATYIIREDVIEVTTLKAVHKEFFSDRPEGQMPPLVSANFDKVPLETALKELSQPDHSIVLDGRAAKEGMTPVTADLTNVPQDTAARMLADMAGLKIVPLDSVLYVTSKDNALVLIEEQETLRLQRQHDKKEKKEESHKMDKKDAKTDKPTTAPK